MRGNSAPVFLFSLLTVVVLAGCAGSPVHLDPLSVDGRDGGGPTPSYPMLMRIGAAAQAGGDLPNAVGVYRRAAEMAPQEPAPLIAAGDVLLQMGAINEAIVSYNAALVRPGDPQAAQIGLAKAFLKTGKPQLALTPLSKALEESPDDPKVLLLLGVARDLAGQHREAQAYYRNGLVRRSRLVARVERRVPQCNSGVTAAGDGADLITAGAADLGADPRSQGEH